MTMSPEFQEHQLKQLRKQLGNKHRLSKTKHKRLALLASKQKQGALSIEEKLELAKLVEEYDELTLKRAEALDTLE